MGLYRSLNNTKLVTWGRITSAINSHLESKATNNGRKNNPVGLVFDHVGACLLFVRCRGLNFVVLRRTQVLTASHITIKTNRLLDILRVF